VQVLDARDPEGTRCKFLEQHIRKNARHKHLLLLLNKCDLVSSRVTEVLSDKRAAVAIDRLRFVSCDVCQSLQNSMSQSTYQPMQRAALCQQS